jgi:hypothetical protein
MKLLLTDPEYNLMRSVRNNADGRKSCSVLRLSLHGRSWTLCSCVLVALLLISSPVGKRGLF